MDAPGLDTIHGGIASAASAGVPTVSAVFLMTLLMAAASGLGALPFFFVTRLSPRLAALANALACGVMLAASFDLVHEGEPHGPLLVVIGLCFGAVFIALTQRMLRDQENVKFGLLRGADARKTLLMIGIMTAHSLGEGSGVGVSFGGERGWRQGTLVTLAIGAHNIPEGMAVATVLAARGVRPWKCALWSVFTSLPQPLLAVPAFMFVETFQALLPLGMGFAAGCMIWITVAELLPDALEGAEATAVATVATVSAAALEAFRMWTAALERAEVGSIGAYAGAHHASSVTKGTYSTENVDVEPDTATLSEKEVRSKHNEKKRSKFEPGLSQHTLTTGSFVPSTKTDSTESAAQALDRLATKSSERKAAALRAAEFARASVGSAVEGIAGNANVVENVAAVETIGVSAVPLAMATMAVPVLCVIAAAFLSKLLGDNDIAPIGSHVSNLKSKRFRGAGVTGVQNAGIFFPERTELLGAAAGAAAAVGFARLADAFRRCRFGDAHWLPAVFGAVVGVLAHTLLAEYVLGRAEAKLRRGEGKRTEYDLPDNNEFDPENGSRSGWNDSRDKNLKATEQQVWSFSGAHLVVLCAVVFASVSEGAGLAVAWAAHGGHAIFPAAARVAPRACAVGWSALASGTGNRWSACRAVFLAVIAEPVVLIIGATLGFGSEGFVPSGWQSTNTVALQSAAAACLFCAAAQTAFGAAKRVDKRSATAGFAVGAAFALVVLGALGALCWQTPYCDRSW